MTDSTSDQDLKEWLGALFLEDGGVVSFERFMREALYHPDFGYYTSHIRTVGGSRGDFATSPTLNTLLGKAIAGWVAAEAQSLELGAPIHVIEIGGGEGSLMRDVIAGLRSRCGGWRRWFGLSRYRFHLVEISPRLRECQQDILAKHRSRITWHDRLETALEAAGGEAVIYSNELVDAFPVVTLCRDEANEGWEELALTFDPDGGLREVRQPWKKARPDLEAADFAVLGTESEWPDGQRVELHAAYRDWLRSWADQWKRGAMLTIDYGSRCPDEIYRRRPAGTLRAYYRHQRLTGSGLYRMFGRQDLTSDVCFADCETWGQELGWETETLQSQAEFLCEWAGPACCEATRADRSAAFLFEPGGAGEAFQVLSQRKG